MIKASTFNPQPHLTYHGGKTLKSPHFGNLFLGRFWQEGSGTKERTYLDNFTKQIVRSSYTNMWKEYGSGKGSFVGSSVVARPSPKRISDKQIQTLVAASIKSGALSKNDNQTSINVFLPPGTTLVTEDGLTSRQGIGGYHGSFDLSPGNRVYYSALAYSNETNGINFDGHPLDNITIATSHEMTETVTDPDVNNGKLGWYDENYGEISDIPLAVGTPLSDVFSRIRGFAVQKNWSEKSHRIK